MWERHGDICEFGKRKGEMCDLERQIFVTDAQGEGWLRQEENKY